jgi:hypothetical protein
MEDGIAGEMSITFEWGEVQIKSRGIAAEAKGSEGEGDAD